MKFTALLFLTAITGAIAGPTTDSSERPSGLVAREACYHQSDCSWFNAARCENHCREYGEDIGVDRMEKCNWLNEKRCCCTS